MGKGKGAEGSGFLHPDAWAYRKERCDCHQLRWGAIRKEWFLFVSFHVRAAFFIARERSSNGNF